MPGFTMAFGGPGPRGRGKGAPQLSCFLEEAAGRPALGKGGALAAPEASANEPDSLDAFMAGIAKEATAPPADGKAAWDELQTDDPVASYCEAFEQQAKAKKRRPAGEDGEGEEELTDEEEQDRRGKPIEPLPPVDHSVIEYPPVRTDFYTPHAEIARLTPEEVSGLRTQLRVAATGSGCPSPVASFAHLGLPQALMQGIRKHGYVRPTPIQAQAIPAGLCGRDVIGIAETGSGKTVAYLMPMLVHCADQPELQKDEGPIGLVLCPTRELAIQIEKETYKFNKALGLRSTTLAGGLSKFQQFKEIKKGSEIVIATPGRIIDIVKMKGCNMRRCSFLVLDEADRMLHMGFEAQIHSIVQNVRPSRQTLLFSATFPPKIERLARELLRDPVRITVGTLGQAAESVTQRVEIVQTDADKWAWLARSLGPMLEKGQVLIFVQSRQRTEELQASVTSILGKSAAVLHGDLDQDERMRVMDSVRKQSVQVLIATDLAARGLDVLSIRSVVSYDIARDIQTHTHRVGRTGRAGHVGEAFTLLTNETRSRRMAAQLVEHLRTVGASAEEALLALARQHVPRPERGGPPGAGPPGSEPPGEAPMEPPAKRPRSASPGSPPSTP